jgi:Uma2 family endonuclease
MSAPLTVPRHTFTVDEYHRMGVPGIFKEHDRIELIEGELIQMAPIGGRHLRLVNVVSEILHKAMSDQALVSTQNPILLPPLNEPQPDIALLKPEFKRREDVPTARDVLLIVEIADTTLAYDRDTKVPIYARFRIPEVWLFDAERKNLFVFLDPSSKGYRKLLTPQNDETISPSLLPGVNINLSDIWL